MTETGSRQAAVASGAKMERVSNRAWSRHRTIGSAVRAAKDGTVIAIAPGVNPESLVLDKAVTLLADGDDGTVELVGGDAPAVAVRAGEATVHGLTLRGSGRDGVTVAVQGGRLTLETAVIDGAWSAVGSSNLDWRSPSLNNEIDAIILGPEFGARMEALFQDDLRSSRAITLEVWRRRGLAERLREMKAKLVERLL